MVKCSGNPQCGEKNCRHFIWHKPEAYGRGTCNTPCFGDSEDKPYQCEFYKRRYVICQSRSKREEAEVRRSNKAARRISMRSLVRSV